MTQKQTNNNSRFSLTRNKSRKRFVDLFAGLGGFHVGLSRLGHECVLASELDPRLRKLYATNFGLTPHGDVRSIDEKTIPDHDVLCAGFPCQPFSRAGKKKGAECPESGKLIDDVFRIVKEKSPNYVMLENVPDILTIENGAFWTYIREGLMILGYDVDFRIYTPQDFGIPQKRKRVFVVASKCGFDHFEWPTPNANKPSLLNIVEPVPKERRPLQKEKEAILNKWQEFIDQIGEFSSLPVLAPEFGATYPYGTAVKTVKEMSSYKGAFGNNMEGSRHWRDIHAQLPHYARRENGLVGYRLAEAIEYSRWLYSRHHLFLDVWKVGIDNLPISWLKFEWQGHRNNPNVWDHLIQFRASGIRIIKPESAPSLIAMSTTQTPIIGPKKRYMSIKEAAGLQSLEDLPHLPPTDSAAYKALGNAVNAHIVQQIAERLVV